MRILILLLFPIIGISQGIEPYQIQYSPYKGGFLKATISVFDEAEQDTVYYYTHVDSIVSGMKIDSVQYFDDSLRIYTTDTTFVTEILSGQEYDLIPYISGGDTIGFILYNSMDTVVFEAGDSIIGGQNIFLAEGYGINIAQLDSLYTISADTSQLATQYDLTQLQSTLTFTDGTTIDFTKTGQNVTAEVKSNSIDATHLKENSVGSSELASSGVGVGTYTNPTITVDVDGRITSAVNGTSSGEIIYQWDNDWVVTSNAWEEDFLQPIIELATTGLYEFSGIITYRTSATGSGLSYGFVSGNCNEITSASGYYAININSSTSAEDNTLFRSVKTLSCTITDNNIDGTGVNPANTNHSGFFSLILNNGVAGTNLYFQIKGETSGQTYTIESDTTYFKLKKL